VNGPYTSIQHRPRHLCKRKFEVRSNSMSDHGSLFAMARTA
jgi:hypothetical protein